MSSLRLFLLGPPRVEHDGVQLEFDTRKNLALIAYLAVTDQSHSREAIVTLLWPELEPSRARAGLRRNLSNLRKALSGELLVADREEVGLDASAGFWLDVAEFRRLLQASETHCPPERDVCPNCLAILAKATELYRGDFLEGFSLRDSIAFDEWQFFETEGLQQELAAALERQVRGHSARRTYSTAIPYARRWLALDPLHEPAHRHLMQLYANTGQRAAALRQHQECTRILEQEVGLSPSAETNALYQKIRSTPEGRLEVGGSSPRPRHNLPAQATAFVGREKEVGEITQRLTGPDCRLLTLVGPGGVGKTRLALAAAESMLNHQPDLFEDGIYFVSLAPLRSADAIAPTMSRILRCTVYEGGTPELQLLEHLRRKRLLLIMDNFEHLPDGVGLLSGVLETAPDVRILATSRTRLKVQGEHLAPVTGMRFLDLEPLASGDVPDDVLDYSAIQLYIQSAQQLCPGYEPGGPELVFIARICHLVQGMPLGIKLAAGWTGVLSTEKIAQEITRSLDFLETDLGDVPDRQRSMRAVFDHSWRLLTDAERESLMRMSVFRGGFTREAAESVTGAGLRELRSLVSKSLLQHGEPGRYEAHELLRYYAAEKLARVPGAEDEVRDRHSAYYSALLGRLEADVKGAQQAAAMAEMDAEIENACLAWDWAADRARADRLDQAMDCLALFCRWRCRYEEGKALFRQAADRLSAYVSQSPMVSGDELRVLARLLVWQCRLWGDDLSDELLPQSLAFLERSELAEHDCRRERAFLLQQMGWQARNSDSGRAEELCLGSLALYRTIEDPHGMAEVMDALGRIAQGNGAFDQARAWHEQELALRRVIGDEWGIARALGQLSFIAQLQRLPDESERLSQESMARLRDIGDEGGVAGVLANLGGILLLHGEPARAEALLRDSPAILNSFGMVTTASNYLLGAARAQLGRYAEARERGLKALGMARQSGYGPHIGLCCWLLGIVAVAEGAYSEAKRWLEESTAVFRELALAQDLSLALITLAFAKRGQGQNRQARQHLTEVLTIRAEVGGPFTAWMAFAVAALLVLDEGDVEGAIELYTLALRDPVAANSRWLEDVAGRHVTARAATLPPDVISAAKEQGRARDLKSAEAELLSELAGHGWPEMPTALERSQ